MRVWRPDATSCARSLEGINDIGLPAAFAPPAEAVSVDEILASLHHLIERAHERELKIFGSTLTPVGGSVYITPEKQAKRQAVNHWIRTSCAFEG